MVNSGYATSSAPESVARSRASAIFSTFPQMSPTVVLIWASATLIYLIYRARGVLARRCGMAGRGRAGGAGVGGGGGGFISGAPPTAGPKSFLGAKDPPGAGPAAGPMPTKPPLG